MNVKKRTFATWLTASVLGAITLVGVGSGFASTSVVPSAAGVHTTGLGSPGSLLTQSPCPPEGLSL